MSMKSEKKFVLTAVTLASAVAFGSAVAGENPFAMQDLGKGYQVAQKHMDGKCGGDKAKDGKCGGDKKDAKGKDGKCGGEKKGKDGKCGEGKCGSKKEEKK
jgi:uncharacterized low-complexity protein